jgi:hypothetical protein
MSSKTYVDSSIRRASLEKGWLFCGFPHTSLRPLRILTQII